MGLVINDKTGDPVHSPKRRDVFEFDEEVSAIFENMALRSIPMYAEVHRLNSAIIQNHYKQYASSKDPYVVVDFGASTGVAFKDLCNRFQFSTHTPIPGLRFVCVDKSSHMLDQMKEKELGVELIKGNVVSMTQDQLPKADIVLMTHFLQFIEPAKKQKVLDLAFSILKYRGLLLLASKEVDSDNPDGVIATTMNKEYYRFRMDNGYSRGEIKAKTRSLKNSMWPNSRYSTINMLSRAGFGKVHELTRWCQFSSLAAIKSRGK